jgi:hypothetical protein
VKEECRVGILCIKKTKVNNVITDPKRKEENPPDCGIGERGALLFLFNV